MAGVSAIRVLVVDDDPLVRAGLTLMLKGADELVVVGGVADGADVGAAVDAHAPDVVLMDIRMPGLNGISDFLPPSSSTSSRSPAPKFSTADTVPMAAPSGPTQARPSRSE